MSEPSQLHAVGELPPAPKHLSTERKKLWNEIVRDYVLGADELALLAQACVSLDRAAAAGVEIEKAGITVEGRYGPRANPAVLIERDAATLASRLFKQLALEPPAAPVDRLALRKTAQR